MSDVFPSWKVRLHLRFEDYGLGFTGGSAVPEAVPTNNKLRGTTIDRKPLTVTPEVDPQSGAKKLVVSQGAPPPGGPSAKQKASADNFTFPIDNVIPRTFDWKQNGIRAPDTLSITLKWDDFPFDPRVVRAVAVEFFLGSLTEDEFAAGIAGATRFSGAGTGAAAPMNLIPDTYLSGGVQRTNSRFVGWVDDFEMGWSEGEPVVKLNCRDQTSLLMTQEHRAGWGLDPKLPLDESIAKYLANYPLFEGLSVEFRPAGSTPPKWNDVMSSASTIPGGVLPVSGGGAGHEKLSVWDYLTDHVVMLGFLIRVDGYSIIVQPPRNLLNNAASPRTDDPYVARTVDGRTYDVRTFIYGEDVSELHVTRKFVRTSTSIEMRSYVPEQKRPLVARAPKGIKPQVDARPGDGKSDQKWTVKVVHGIKDLKQLQQLADSAYEMMNRYELAVNVKTRDLWSFGGSSVDPDVLDMKAGDSFQVMVKRGKTASTITEKESLLSVFGLGSQALQDLGYETAIANAHEKAVTNAGFASKFLAREVNISGSVDNGVAVDVVGVNYVEARCDAPPTDNPYPQGAPK